ncbi:hypothetical protein [Streptomyces sp. NPDC056543]
MNDLQVSGVAKSYGPGTAVSTASTSPSEEGNAPPSSARPAVARPLCCA